MLPINRMSAALLACALSTGAHAVTNLYACGDLSNAFGPFDYRVVAPNNREVVETHHFTPQVETLRSGQSSYLGGDIDYTLRAMPNHPRALLSMVRLGQKEKTDRTQGSHFSVECYLDRAIRFAPDDPMPRLIYAMYLRPLKRTAEMRQQLDEAIRLRGEPTSSDLDYNAGLLYFELGDYDKAAAAAKRAYALGAPFPALKNKLKSVGKAASLD